MTAKEENVNVPLNQDGSSMTGLALEDLVYIISTVLIILMELKDLLKLKIRSRLQSEITLHFIHLWTITLECGLGLNLSLTTINLLLMV